jgi:hypothetical protein
MQLNNNPDNLGGPTSLVRLLMMVFFRMDLDVDVSFSKFSHHDKKKRHVKGPKGKQFQGFKKFA